MYILKCLLTQGFYVFWMCIKSNVDEYKLDLFWSLLFGDIHAATSYSKYQLSKNKFWILDSRFGNKSDEQRIADLVF